jgi:hypothetical protein
MTHIVFYEKPGSGGNAKQRAALARPASLEGCAAVQAPCPSP